MCSPMHAIFQPSPTLLIPNALKKNDPRPAETQGEGNINNSQHVYCLDVVEYMQLLNVI